MHFLDCFGLIGVLITLIAYFLLQTERLPSTGICYSLLNTIGSALIIYTLLYHWNLSAFLMEGSWLLLSAYGVIKAWRHQ